MLKKILTGLQCTGNLHLGNILSVMKPTIGISKKSDIKEFVFLADLHSLTSIKNSSEIENNVYNSARVWLALGLDYNNVIFYRQSRIRGICELMWILNCLTPYPMLANAHAFKEKSGNLSDINVGLFDYPVLMSADILLFKADLVLVGKDQKQHIEITRDIAKSFNNNFGNIFTIPEAYIDEKIQLIPGIDGRKMSKSYKNTIDIFADKDSLKKDIMRIKTDCKTQEESKNPDECIIFNIYKTIANEENVENLRVRYLNGNIGYKEAKELLYETILKTFEEARYNFRNIKNDKEIIEKIFREGEKKAQEYADETLISIKKTLHFE